jgi:hypothetical protein
MVVEMVAATRAALIASHRLIAWLLQSYSGNLGSCTQDGANGRKQFTVAELPGAGPLNFVPRAILAFRQDLGPAGAMVSSD